MAVGKGQAQGVAALGQLLQIAFLQGDQTILAQGIGGLIQCLSVHQNTGNVPGVRIDGEGQILLAVLAPLAAVSLGQLVGNGLGLLRLFGRGSGFLRLFGRLCGLLRLLGGLGGLLRLLRGLGFRLGGGFGGLFDGEGDLHGTAVSGGGDAGDGDLGLPRLDIVGKGQGVMGVLGQGLTLHRHGDGGADLLAGGAIALPIGQGHMFGFQCHNGRGGLLGLGLCRQPQGQQGGQCQHQAQTSAEDGCLHGFRFLLEDIVQAVLFACSSRSLPQIQLFVNGKCWKHWISE